MNNENREEKKEKKQVGLTTKILFGLLFGAITGFVLNYAVPDSYFKNTIVINGQPPRRWERSRSCSRR